MRGNLVLILGKPAAPVIMASPPRSTRHFPLLLVLYSIILDAPPALSADASSPFFRARRWPPSFAATARTATTPPSGPRRRGSHAPPDGAPRASVAFQHRPGRPLAARPLRSDRGTTRGGGGGTALCAGDRDTDPDDAAAGRASFLSTGKASVSFLDGGISPANLSAVDRIIFDLTSDRFSLLLGSVGIVLLLLNRLASFPEDAVYEASRSRVDLLGVFAAGSLLLNGITKLDVESVQAERVALEGVAGDGVTWNALSMGDETFRVTVEWALTSFLKCSPARTAVLLASNPKEDERWTPFAVAGVLPSDPKLRASIPESVASTPILDRMLRDDGGIKGGTVGGAGAARGPKESYLPTLQALPGRVEFTYLPPNAQEALLLPVPRPGGEVGGGDGWYYAVVLGGDTAKSFAPRDIAWCKEIASWICDPI